MSAPHQDSAMTFENAVSMGLSQAEWDLILTRLGRTPNPVSYTHLTLPTICSV